QRSKRARFRIGLFSVVLSLLPISDRLPQRRREPKRSRKFIFGECHAAASISAASFGNSFHSRPSSKRPAALLPTRNIEATLSLWFRFRPPRLALEAAIHAGDEAS